MSMKAACRPGRTRVTLPRTTSPTLPLLGLPRRSMWSSAMMPLSMRATRVSPMSTLITRIFLAIPGTKTFPPLARRDFSSRSPRRRRPRRAPACGDVTKRPACGVEAARPLSGDSPGRAGNRGEAGRCQDGDGPLIPLGVRLAEVRLSGKGKALPHLSALPLLPLGPGGVHASKSTGPQGPRRGLRLRSAARPGEACSVKREACLPFALVNPLLEVWLLVGRELRKTFRSVKGLLMLGMSMLGATVSTFRIPKIEESLSEAQKLGPDKLHEAKARLFGDMYLNDATGERLADAPIKLVFLFYL